MDKLKMQTENIADKNFEVLSKMFPNALTETITGYDDDGKPIVERAIDADVLRQEISCKVVEGKDERYQFTWPDKKKAIMEANMPINKSLRPCIEESVDFSNTENLYIEGDNLEILKLLQETYLEKIKMIYIDPPYNTGNDFNYNDNYEEDTDEYIGRSGQLDEYGNRLVKNIETNGRFHTDWLNMIYPRIKLARNLLREDGVIMISMDDGEYENLKRICNEIFGEKNFIECLIWKKRATPPNDKNIGRIHEFILCYAKDIEKVSLGLLPRDAKSIERYANPDNDPRGPWVASDLSANGKGGRIVRSCVYPIRNPSDGKDYYPSEGRCWLFNKEKMNIWIKEGRVSFRETTGAPFLKRYLSEVRQGLTLPTIMTEFGYSMTSAAEADKLFKKKGIFEYAKPTTLINPLLRIGAPNKKCIVLDFFSGSATTAHALMQLNAENEGRRKYIMVQIPEKTDEKSEAYKSGYLNICEVGKDRIKKASELFADKNIDVGFRVLKLGSSNMKDVYYNPSETQQSLFDTYADNIKEDRTPEDLLFQVMLDLGVLLSSKIEETTIAGKQVFNVADGFLIACFDNDVTEETVKAVAEKKPYYAVFRDSSMANDSVATNFDQIFASISPDTVRKVL